MGILATIRNNRPHPPNGGLGNKWIAFRLYRSWDFSSGRGSFGSTVRNSKLIVSAMAINAALGIGSACAADLAARPYTKAPTMVAEVYNWTGFYVGGEVGWEGSRQDGRSDPLPAGFGAPPIAGAGLAGFGLLPTNHGLNRDGVIGGIYLGYNWQVGHTVFGLEGDVNYLDRSGSSTQTLFATFSGTPTARDATINLSADTRWIGTVRGRIGYAWDRFMVYGTGGVAFTEAQYSIKVVSAAVGGLNGGPPTSIGFSQDKVGYAAGAGVEWMFAPNWIGRLEYMHYGFGGSNGVLPIVIGTCTAAVNCRFAASTSDLNINSVRVGLSYKFGAPVVAKY
jgi:outer membrane immunogenic protein